MARATAAWILRFFFFGAIILFCSVDTAQAQARLCDSAPAPCLDQPKEPDGLITGKAETGAVVVVTVDQAEVGTARGLADGTFKVAVNPLVHGHVVNAGQISPQNVQLGPAEVARVGVICGATSPLPCLTQPSVSGTQITGKAESGATIAVTVDGVFGGAAKALQNQTFTIYVSMLHAGQKIVTTQTDPEVVIIGPVTPSDPTQAAKPVAKAGTICGPKTTVFCLDQPHEKDVKVSGSVAVDAGTGKPLSVSSVNVWVDDETPASADVDVTTGKFTKNVTMLSQHDNVHASQAVPGVVAPTTEDVKVVAAVPAKTSTTGSSLYALGLVGINATGSSSSGPSQQYFVSFDLAAPLPFLPRRACSDPKVGDERNNSADANDDAALSRRCWLWVNPRIASAPAASSTAVSSLSPTSFPAGISSLNVGQITQTFEVQAGAEYYLRRPSDARYWGPIEPWTRSSLSLIVGGGTVTPFSVTAGATEFGLNGNLAQQFAQNPSLETQYPQLAGALCSYGLTSSPPSFVCPATPMTKPTSVAFLLPNRSRFDRDFFGGFRLRYFYSTGDCGSKAKTDSCTLANTYPGTVDFRFGEDETVTGGKLVPLVMTVTGSFPLPATGGLVRVFGSTYVRLHGNQNTTPLVLIPTSPALSLDNPALVIQQTPRSDQDYFRFGIGVDLVALVAKWAKPASTTTSGADATTGTSTK
jgi:hypothetical protein